MLALLPATELAPWLLPVSTGGAVEAAGAVILADSCAGPRTGRAYRPRVPVAGRQGLTWLLLVLGLPGSLSANIVLAEPTLTACAVAAWLPVRLALALAGGARAASRRLPAAASGGPGS